MTVINLSSRFQFLLKLYVALKKANNVFVKVKTKLVKYSKKINKFTKTNILVLNNLFEL